MASKPIEGASVIACLHELWPDFQLTNANQMNPTSDIAIKFYERFICGQLQIEITELKRMLIEKSSCKDAFESILNVYTLYICTATVIQKLGLNELFQTFGLTDLLSPMRKKFKMSLILLSNCVIYVTGLQEFMEDVKNKVCKTISSFKDNHEKIDDLKERINSAVILHLKNTQKKEELRKKTDLLYKDIRSGEEELKRSKDETTLQQLELNQIQEQYNFLDAKLNNLLEIEEKLQSLIVDDYQNILYEKDRLVKERNELLTDFEAYKTLLNNKLQTIACYQKNLNCTDQFLETIPLSKLLEMYEILHKYSNEIEQYQNEIKSLQETECLDAADLKKLQDMKDSMEQKIQETIMKHENQMKIFHKEIEDLHGEITMEEDKKSKYIKLSDNLDIKLQQVNTQSQQYEEQIEKQNAYYDTKYKEILEFEEQLDNKVMFIVNNVEQKFTLKNQ